MNALHTHSVFAHEQAKYSRLWREIPAYREYSPGEVLVGPFLSIMQPSAGSRIVDVGSGPGRAARSLIEKGYRLTLVDAVRDALDPDIAASDAPYIFHESCVWADWPARVFPQDVAFCCDVLEHIPQEFTMLTIARCLQAAPRAFFHINMEIDRFGETIDAPLHMTVQSFAWWRDRLADVGRLSEARDLLGSGLFVVERM